MRSDSAQRWSSSGRPGRRGLPVWSLRTAQAIARALCPPFTYLWEATGAPPHTVTIPIPGGCCITGQAFVEVTLVDTGGCAPGLLAFRGRSVHRNLLVMLHVSGLSARRFLQRELRDPRVGGLLPVRLEVGDRRAILARVSDLSAPDDRPNPHARPAARRMTHRRG
jgi:hypothetical protein